MTVWRLTPDRASEWREIRLAALRDAPDAFDAALADWQDRPLADFAKRLRDVPTFAAGDAPGQPLATASWMPGLDDRDPLRGWLLAVFALPQARGQGHATAAIRAALDDAMAQGMTSMGLNVRDTASHAQALYRRLGFRATGRPGVTNARGLPETEMLKDLP